MKAGIARSPGKFVIATAAFLFGLASIGFGIASIYKVNFMGEFAHVFGVGSADLVVGLFSIGGLFLIVGLVTGLVNLYSGHEKAKAEDAQPKAAALVAKAAQPAEEEVQPPVVAKAAAPASPAVVEPAVVVALAVVVEAAVVVELVHTEITEGSPPAQPPVAQPPARALAAQAQKIQSPVRDMFNLKSYPACLGGNLPNGTVKAAKKLFGDSPQRGLGDEAREVARRCAARGLSKVSQIDTVGGGGSRFIKPTLGKIRGARIWG